MDAADGFHAAGARIPGTQLYFRDVHCVTTSQPTKYFVNAGSLTGPAGEVQAFISEYGDVTKPAQLQLHLSTGPLVELGQTLLIQISVGVAASAKSGADALVTHTNLCFYAGTLQYLESQPEPAGTTPLTPTPVETQDAAAGTACGASMEQITFSHFIAAANRHGGPAVRDCGNGHWQAKFGPVNVNVYPYAHPAKYVLQGPGTDAVVVEGANITTLALIEQSLNALYTTAFRQGVQATNEKQNCDAGTTGDAEHAGAAELLQQQIAFRDEILAKLGNLKSIDDVRVTHTTQVVVFGSENAEGGDNFLVGKLDGLMTAYKLISDLGEQGVGLIEQQINALRAVVYPPQTGDQSAPQDAQAACSA